MHVTVDGLLVRAIFSGDTIIDPSHWGEQELAVPGAATSDRFAPPIRKLRFTGS